MTRRLALARRLARISLLLAALLQGVVAGGGPWAHLESLLPVASAEAASPSAPVDGSGDGEFPAPHDGSSCLFCHTLPGAALAEGPQLVPGSIGRVAVKLPEVPAAPARLERGPPSARAPPLA